MKVKNVSAKTTKFTIKLKKKATTSFYIKAFVKTKVNGKTKTVYGKASNTEKSKSQVGGGTILYTTELYTRIKKKFVLKNHGRTIQS